MFLNFYFCHFILLPFNFIDFLQVSYFADLYTILNRALLAEEGFSKSGVREGGPGGGPGGARGGPGGPRGAPGGVRGGPGGGPGRGYLEMYFSV